jgi:ubiquinone/menaquinone biosynthesis C-methylase UbiE
MTTKTDKGYRGVGMEGSIARWYAKNTGKNLTRFEDIAKQVSELAPGDGHVLEVAPGPGYASIALARAGYTVTGLDISQTFVDIARRNAAEAGLQVDFRHGNASAMPFDDESFDAIICSAAFKNFSNPVGALREMYRVLSPGGTALILDLRRDVSKQGVRDEVARMDLNAINRALTTFTLCYLLPRRAYTKAQFEELVAQTGCASVEIRESGIGLEVEMHK